MGVTLRESGMLTTQHMYPVKLTFCLSSSASSSGVLSSSLDFFIFLDFVVSSDPGIKGHREV